MLTSILQPTHLIIVLIVALVLGPKRLPEAGRALGQGLRVTRALVSVGHDDHAHEVERDDSREASAQ